jgi:hypothetical protein
MQGETNLNKILRTLNPVLNKGEFVFCQIKSLEKIDLTKVLYFFKEQEGYTVVLEKGLADTNALDYYYIASWITLTVHSSLESLGLTALFSASLADASISCNVVAALNHDHIFVSSKDAHKAMKVLSDLSNNAF